ncbi:MAG: BamA/TamA family outer membrane protein, partial [Proteobacteria bacterium]|nr:BamA/TamA family outer membrane protein [Pseudomonadota bacterium]
PDATAKENYYRNQFGIMLVKARLNMRIRLVHMFYALTGASFRYTMPTVYDGSALEEDAGKKDEDREPLITGTAGQTIFGFHLGVGFDSRDNNINPERGMFHELVFSGYPGRLDSVDFPLYGSVTLNTRFYIPLAGEYLVLALRFRGDLIFGAAPFYDLDLGLIRGVPLRRFHGLIHMLGNLEFRSIFLRFSSNKQQFALGAAAFVDSGRVWADYRYCTVLDGTGPGLKYGVGGGVRFLIGKGQLVRLDVAYSPYMKDLNPDMPVGIYAAFGQFF